MALLQIKNMFKYSLVHVVRPVLLMCSAKATSDEELAFKQKERELASYTRKAAGMENIAS